jgi:hypothetical protein
MTGGLGAWDEMGWREEAMNRDEEVSNLDIFIHACMFIKWAAYVPNLSYYVTQISYDPKRTAGQELYVKY